jgi:hypothetical protein
LLKAEVTVAKGACVCAVQDVHEDKGEGEVAVEVMVVHVVVYRIVHAANLHLPGALASVFVLLY